MHDKEKISELVATVQKDINKFDELHNAISKQIYFWCYNTVGNTETAKDLMQESMIRIARGITSLDNPDNFTGWAFVVTKNVCKSYHRSNVNADKPLDEFAEDEESLVNTITDDSIDHHPEKKFQDMNRKQLVIKFIENLPQKQKEVIILFYLEQLSIPEIATMLKSKVPTIKSNLFSGRKNLEKQARDYQEQNGVRLYNKGILAVLALILFEYREYICSGVDLSFDPKILKLAKTPPVKPSGTKAVGQWVSSHVPLISVSTVALVTLVVGASLLINGQGNPSSPITDKIVDKDSSDEELKVKNDMEKKMENTSIIHSIHVPTFPTREKVVVTVNLREEVAKDKMSIKLKDVDIPFEIIGKEARVEINQNGTYSLLVNEDKATFQVQSIHEFAPIVTSVTKYDDYISFDVNGEQSFIDYEKSYMLVDGIQYPLTTENTVQGTYSGNIRLYLYSGWNEYMYYDFKL